ncbi:MAG: methionyl-tRNA formyltransferase [Eubacterium sp.]|nr:methionyl-tRNA formyltransferase [Eubacterium sp.]
MRVIFMGTPEFSLPVLKALHASEHEVTAVITQPDKPRGRSGKSVPTPVGMYAGEHGISLYTPEKVRDPEFIDAIKRIPCDVIIVVAFGQILPGEILHYPKYGCINVHASILPRWRGAAPMQWAIIEGDEVTGVTIMQMDEGLDTGDILLVGETDIAPDETVPTLGEKLADLGADLLMEALDRISGEGLVPIRQDDEKSTYAKMITKEMGRIDFSDDAKSIERRIRGLAVWPGVSCGYRGRKLKLYRAAVTDDESGKAPGTVTAVTKGSFFIQTGRGQLEILEVQPEGKKRMDAGGFLNGNHITVGEVFV